jgi:hypothetical protein
MKYILLILCCLLPLSCKDNTVIDTPTVTKTVIPPVPRITDGLIDTMEIVKLAKSKGFSLREYDLFKDSDQIEIWTKLHTK